jgi:hypothetical protein
LPAYAAGEKTGEEVYCGFYKTGYRKRGCKGRLVIMKKYLVTFCCLVIMAMAAGCADKASSGRNGYQSAGVSDVLEDRMAEEDAENGTVKNEEMIAGNDEVILQSGDNMDAPDTDGESLVSDAGSEASEGVVEEGAEESGSDPETDASGQAGETEGTGGGGCRNRWRRSWYRCGSYDTVEYNGLFRGIQYDECPGKLYRQDCKNGWNVCAVSR